MKNILLILFSISFLITEASTIDSLTNVIKKEKNESLKFETYSKLINQYLNIDPAKAEEISLNQISLSKTKTEKANSFLNLALSQDYQYKFDSAINNYHKAYNFFELNNDTVGLSRVLLNLGIVNYYKGDIDSSIFFYVKTLHFAEKIGQKRLVSSAYSNLGSIHRELGEYKTSLKYHNKSLQIEEEYNSCE